MISKPRYEPRRIGETKVWRIFDTFVQEWAQGIYILDYPTSGSLAYLSGRTHILTDHVERPRTNPGPV